MKLALMDHERRIPNAYEFLLCKHGLGQRKLSKQEIADELEGIYGKGLKRVFETYPAEVFIENIIVADGIRPRIVVALDLSISGSTGFTEARDAIERAKAWETVEYLIKLRAEKGLCRTVEFDVLDLG